MCFRRTCGPIDSRPTWLDQMAHKATVTVGYVSITSFCRLHGKTVKTVSCGTKNVEHVIEMDNGSTLPQDVTVKTVLPDAPPLNSTGVKVMEFGRSGSSPAESWDATVLSLASRSSHQEVAHVHSLGPRMRQVRIQSPDIYYRRGSGVNWETESITRVLGIEMDVI